VRPLGGAYTIQVAPGQSSEPSGSGCISSDNAFISSRGLLIIAAEWIPPSFKIKGTRRERLVLWHSTRRKI